jgi:hypothetical protein
MADSIFADGKKHIGSIYRGMAEGGRLYNIYYDRPYLRQCIDIYESELPVLKKLIDNMLKQKEVLDAKQSASSTGGSTRPKNANKTRSRANRA